MWRGIFPGERVRPHRSSGEKGGSLPVSSELLNMLLHVRSGRWWKGEFFRGWSLSEEDVRESLFVSCELLNMLLHVTPGRWSRGEFFSGRELVLVGLPVKIGEFVRKFQVTKMLLHVTLERWWRGDISSRFLRGGLVHSLLRSLVIC